MLPEVSIGIISPVDENSGDVSTTVFLKSHLQSSVSSQIIHFFSNLDEWII